MNILVQSTIVFLHFLNAVFKLLFLTVVHVCSEHMHEKISNIIIVCMMLLSSDIVSLVCGTNDLNYLN